MGLRKSGAGPTADAGALKVWYEAKVMPETVVVGNPEVSPLSGVTRLSPSGAGTNAVGNGALGAVNGQTPVYRQTDGRRCMQFTPTVALNSLWVFQPNATAAFSNFFVDFQQVVFPTVAPVGDSDLVRQPSWQVSCWLRKAAAGDASDCQHVIGFANTKVVGGQTAEIPRIGLLGDGALGYRFGSVNAPDGAAAGINAATDIDVGSVQPSVLVNPGTNWFHVRIKMIPPSVSVAGRWAAYFNGALVAQFANLANMPRGHQGVNDDFGQIQLVVGSYFRAAGVIPAPHIHDLRIRIADDWSV